MFSIDGILETRVPEPQTWELYVRVFERTVDIEQIRTTDNCSIFECSAINMR